MASPFHVSCAVESVPLFQLADGRFQLTKDGPIALFMNGPRYFLIEEPLANFIEQLDVQGIRVESATIWDRGRNIEYSTHKLLVVNHCFTPGTETELDLHGEAFFALYDTYLFASPKLKKRLESGPFSYLRFTEGLGEFAS